VACRAERKWGRVEKREGGGGGGVFSESMAYGIWGGVGGVLAGMVGTGKNLGGKEYWECRYLRRYQLWRGARENQKVLSDRRVGGGGGRLESLMSGVNGFGTKVKGNLRRGKEGTRVEGRQRGWSKCGR